MSKPGPSIFRDALQVSRERIAAMSEEDLDVLMLQLLQAQAYRCGSPVNEICVNTEGKARDDGCDGCFRRLPDLNALEILSLSESGAAAVT